MTQFITTTLDYFFSFNPPIRFGLQWIVWIIVALGIIAGFALIILIRTNKSSHFKKSVQEFPGKLITISFLLLINVFSRFNRIEVLSMRIITYLLVAWLLFTFFQLYQALFIKLPSLKQTQEVGVESLEKKYHIHKNKKRKSRKR